MRYQQDKKDLPAEELADACQANVEAIVSRALELGINHIETARGYRNSERQLGKILKSLPRENLIVQTKVTPNESQDKFRTMAERSLSLLDLDHVDLFSIHGINTPELLDYALRPGGCLEVAKQLRSEGRVRFIGFSTHAPTDVIIRAIDTGEFDYLNMHWYYINQINWPAVQAARRQDMGVFIISPSDKGGRLYEPPQKLVDLCAPLSPMVFNDLFCLNHPEVNTLSIGAARPTDFDEHVKTLDHLDRADELLTPIIERLEKQAADVLGADWARTWHEGLPLPEDTPGNISIHTILLLRNLALAYEMMGYGRERYNMLGQASHWLPGQKAKNLDEVDLSECLAGSPHADKIPRMLAETHDLLDGKPGRRLGEN